MKKTTQIFLGILLLLSSSWATAEDVTVKVASDRSAVVHVTSTAGDPDVSGTVKGGANLKEGKGGLRADLTIKNAKELEGAQADMYAKMTGNTIEAVGYLNAKVPADPTAPKVFDVNVETVTDGDQSAGNFKIAVEAPKGAESVPKGSGSIKGSGDFKAFKSSGDFEFSGADIKGSEIPFTHFELTISEAGAGPQTKTTIAFKVTAPKDSPVTQNLGQLPGMVPMLEQQLKSSQIKYEGISFPAPTVEGTNSTSTGTITLVDVRATIKPFLPMMAQQMPQGGPELQKGLEDIIETRMDKIAFTMDVKPDAVNGNFNLDLSALDKFFSGYLALLPVIQQESNQNMMAEAGEFGVILGPLLKLNTEQAVESIKILSSSSLTLDGEAKFTLDTKGDDANKMVTFNADGQVSSKNYQDYVTKAKAAGLPVAEKAVGKLTIGLKDQTALTGDAYLFTDGPLVNYYKGMLGKAAKEAKLTEDVQKAITELSFNDISAKMTLKDNKLTILGSSNTSDLTKLVGLALKQGVPQFQADLTGGSVDVTMDDKGTGKSDVKVNFANFLPGKDAAGIKEVLGLPANATVTMDAPAADVALVAVEQPEIAVDGNLVAVQTEGQKLLNVSAAEVAAGATGGGGGSKWGLIAVGVLLLAGVGGFLAFGKKS